MKRQTIVVDVNAPRRTTPLQEWREKVDSLTQSGDAPSSAHIGGGLPYCPTTSAGTPPLQVDLDAILDELGNEVGSIGPGGQITLDESLTNTPVLMANAARDADTLFVLPTPVSRITDVWFDYIHAEPITMWQVNPNNTITSTVPLPASVLVSALYVAVVD